MIKKNLILVTIITLTTAQNLLCPPPLALPEPKSSLRQFGPRADNHVHFSGVSLEGLTDEQVERVAQSVDREYHQDLFTEETEDGPFQTCGQLGHENLMEIASQDYLLGQFEEICFTYFFPTLRGNLFTFWNTPVITNVWGKFDKKHLLIKKRIIADLNRMLFDDCESSQTQGRPRIYRTLNHAYDEVAKAVDAEMRSIETSTDQSRGVFKPRVRAKVMCPKLPRSGSAPSCIMPEPSEFVRVSTTEWTLRPEPTVPQADLPAQDSQPSAPEETSTTPTPAATNLSNTDRLEVGEFEVMPLAERRSWGCTIS